MKRHQKDNELAHYVKSFNLSTRLTHFKSIHSKQTDSLSLSLSLSIYIYIYTHHHPSISTVSASMDSNNQGWKILEKTNSRKFQKAKPEFSMHCQFSCCIMSQFIICVFALKGTFDTSFFLNVFWKSF